MSGDVAKDEPLAGLRRAAAVLAAFDPVTLAPAGAEATTRSGLELLPELVRVSRSGAAQWSLPTGARQRELQRLGSRAAMRAALAANPARVQGPVQQMFERLLVDDAAPLRLPQLDHEELAALLPVSQWLAGIVADVPRAEEVRAEIERRAEEVALRRLADEFFVGREGELQQLWTHLHGTGSGPPILFLCGPGGSGKSTLIARLLLDWPVQRGEDRRLRTYIDLDHPACSPEQPLSILTLVAAQLVRQDRSLERLSAGLSDRITRASNALDDQAFELAIDRQGLLDDAIRWFTRLTGNTAMSLILDTFEEAQFLGEEVETLLMRFLAELTRANPHLRVLVCGRVPPRGVAADLCAVLELPDLPQPAAAELLGRTLAAQPAVAPVEAAIVEDLAARLGGNPLTLRLAAPLIAREGAERVAADEAWLGNIHAEAFQARLYARTLGHIHDPDVARLAVPGLVVRRVTPEVVREVLAAPCGLGEVSERRAQELFDGLACEVALVQRDGDGSLRHRSDVRRAMLAGLPPPLTATAQEIDARAVAYWFDKPGPTARAEELYHRLRLEHSTNVLEDRWDPEAAPLLRGALEELPPASASKLWLASKLSVSVSSEERALVDLAAWEQQAARTARRLLGAGLARDALKVLRERSERTTASPVDLLEARALLQLGSVEHARKVLHSAESRLRPGDAERAVELYLLMAWTAERSGSDDALDYLDKASRWTEGSSDPLLVLQVNVRRLRILRLRDAVDEALAEQEQISRLLSLIQWSRLADRPSLVRELAAEVGEHNPDWLVTAVDLLGDDAFDAIGREELVAFIASISRSGQDGIEPYKNDHELRQFARKRIQDGIYGELAIPVARKTSKLFKRAVEILHRAELGVSLHRATPLRALTRPELSQLYESVAAFRDSELRAICYDSLSVDFDANLFSRGNSPELASFVIRWATERDMLDELLRGLIAAAPSQKVRNKLAGILAALENPP
ncbi:ATP-binding protein [Nannocystis sp. SCPEA4]|uniref:AAA family ATPase n=1 Tax=Nannocystis sp. SCPEA4 TaxID=2996787 RepID=UPI002270BD58|nr:ATP-binding protein [Nannocystis sp. SCPEA4]